MTIQDWGAIGELVGGVAVIVTLIYLALQVRQNTRQFSRTVEATQLAAFERNVESGNRIRELLLLHPDLIALLLKGYDSYKELDTLEKIRFGMLLRNIFSAMQGGYVRQLSVEHDPRGFEGIARVVDEILVNRGAREWLENNEPDWRPAFREFVDERLAAIKQRKGRR